MSNAAAGAESAAKMVGHETISVVTDYIIPLGAGLGGFIYGANVLGGANVANAMYNGGLKTNSNLSGRLGGGVMAIITAGIGYCFWRLGHRDGWIVKIIGRGLGAFCFGTALNYTLYDLLGGSNPPTGLIDKLGDSIGSVAQ